jgi:hypothetical protein
VVSLDGHQTQTQTILLEAGQAEDVTLTLERTPLGPEEALLILTTEPQGARITFNGETYEGGSPYELRVPARSYRLVVQKTNYRNDERSVALPGGEVTELAVTLERERRRGGGGTTPTPMGGPGQLTFDARPWCNVSLPSGRHRVTCTNPDLGVTRNVTVEIRPGETTRKRVNLQ